MVRSFQKQYEIRIEKHRVADNYSSLFYGRSFLVDISKTAALENLLKDVGMQSLQLRATRCPSEATRCHQCSRAQCGHCESTRVAGACQHCHDAALSSPAEPA